MERNRTSSKEVTDAMNAAQLAWKRLTAAVDSMHNDDTETAREAVKVAKDAWLLLATEADRLNNALSR